MTRTVTEADPTELEINPETVCFIIVKAREFEGKDVQTNPDANSDDDDIMQSVLEDGPGDSVEEELTSTISDLNIDEQVDLVALAWLGRGDGTADDWTTIRAEAMRGHNKHTAAYLLGIPLLPDYLEEGLSQLGYSCEAFETGHL
jgi:hypothetical protein